MGAVSNHDAPLPTQLLVNVPRKATESGLSIWTPPPTWETWKNSQLLVSAWLSPSCAAIWDVNQQMDDFSLCLFLSFSLNFVFWINNLNKILKRKWSCKCTRTGNEWILSGGRIFPFPVWKPQHCAGLDVAYSRVQILEAWIMVIERWVAFKKWVLVGYKELFKSPA